MRSLCRVLLVLALAQAAGCADCGGCGLRGSEELQARTSFDGCPEELEDGRPLSRPEAGSRRPGGDGGARKAGRSPLVVAQQFVVGWASGRVEPLADISDGEAADLVQRSLAGETVDTPLGSMAPGPRPGNAFSFADRRAEIEGENHRISFTMTARRAGQQPVTTSHVVLIRRSDSKVVGWIAPSPLSDGGV